MKAPITPTQAWAVLAEHYGWADGSKAELSVLPDHPEPRTMRWSRLEEDAIQAYGAACAAHAREMALSDAKAMGKTLTYQPTDPIDFTAYQEGYMDAITEFYAAIEALKGK